MLRTRWLKVTVPTRSSSGTWSMKSSAARRAAASRVGSTSRASIEPEMSVVSITDARESGTDTVASGRARATASAVKAIAYSTIGAWRRQPGREGATESSRRGLAKAEAARRRRRSPTQ